MTDCKRTQENEKKIYLNLYKKYIQDPLNNSFDVVSYGKSSSMWTQELYEIYKKSFHKDLKYYYNISLGSNGSLHSSFNRYNYTYHSFVFKDNIWNYMHRFFMYKKKFWIEIFDYGESDITEQIINEGFFTKVNLKNFCDKYKKSNIFEKAIFVMYPMTLQIIINNAEIINFLKKNEISISLTGCSSEFYDFSILDEYKIPWTNQMRSWKEGTSFYTCPYKKRHWMENLFYCTEDKKIIDLLNFHNNWWMNSDANPDNIWPLEKEFKQCECGTWYREMNFQPHAINVFYDYNNKMSCPLHNDIKLRFINNFDYFQIIQQRNKQEFLIHANRNMSKEETNQIEKYIEFVYKSSIYSYRTVNYVFELGRNKKKPLFWSLYYPKNIKNEKEYHFKRE